jgi:hypothetical protein
MTYNLMILSIVTLSIMTLNIMKLSMIAEHCYALLSVTYEAFMLTVVILTLAQHPSRAVLTTLYSLRMSPVS